MDIFNYKTRSNRFPAKCGVEIYRNHKSAVVVVTELADNDGMSICNAFEDLFLQVTDHYNLDPARLLWVEHWEAGATSDGKEEWHKVNFKWDGKAATNPRWVYISASFVEAVKSVLS